ncbi:MAG: hypothetical protein NC301_02830 [Bacteroides sp.]|nr:hypothetical protein [Lachnospiraceae bacterium]MCM1309945.1 hypothetical protein [Bacteroides sp.]MCM1379667.1 hypothetical protein [Bacteroides sp.]MCM1445951.1 hypothetical protein [Prevotella sp.]
MDGNITFTRLPTKLIYILDSDLLKMLTLLIQQEDYWTNAKKLEQDGSFYKAMNEFAEVFRKKNLQDVRLMLQTLQSKEIIEIIHSRSKKQSNYYRINWNKIAEYNDIPIPQLLQSPMIRTAKRKNKSSVDSTESYHLDVNSDSTELYHQSFEDSTESYQQDSDLIVQGCTSTIDNINNINNNITIDNSEFTKSPLYDKCKKRFEEMITDYINEEDYIDALDKHSSIENFLELVATEYIPTEELEVYKSQLTEATLNHECRGWNIKLDRITDEMIPKYHDTNILNVKTPTNFYQFTSILNNLIGKVDLYVSSSSWEELIERMKIWIFHQWERGTISYNCRQESIEKIYSILAS